nr:cullin, conserved site-containing protein [Tanacetum cinerariifolium]
MFQVGSCSDMVLKALVVKFTETHKEWELLLKHHGCWADPVQTAIGLDRQLAGGPRNWAAAEDDQIGGPLGLGRLKDKASLQEVKGSPVGSLSSSLLKAPNLDKVSPAASGRTLPRKSHAKIELKCKEASKFTGTTGTQKSGKGSLLMSKDCGSVKDLSVVSFLKTHASSQTAMTAFKKAEESKDYADRLKIFGFDYECNDAYFDSALKFLHDASLLEAYYNDFRKLKGMVDPLSVYSTAAKLSKICAEEYEKQKEMAVAALAYKCMEVAYMRVVYCKSFMTKQDLQMSMQMVTQGESPSSST